MKSTVYDVAAYILDKMGPMSAMKLQKLLFYCQAMALVWDDVPLFDHEFEAWAKGPVCRELYELHKGAFLLRDASFLDKVETSPDNISKEHKETIDVVLRSLGDKSPYELSEMTHSEDPWRDARGGLKEGAQSTAVIPKRAMLEYYQENW